MVECLIRKPFLIFAMLLASSLSLSGSVTIAHGTSGLTVNVDSISLTVDPHGNANETVFISGAVGSSTLREPIVIQILDPNNQYYSSYQIPWQNVISGTYHYRFSVGEKQPVVYGRYMLIASVDGQRAETTFSFLPRSPPNFLCCIPTPVPYFGPLDHTYNITIGNQSYPIRYGILGNGTVESMVADYSSKTITIMVDDQNIRDRSDYSNSTDNGGLMAIELPRNVIDSNTTKEAEGCSSFNPSNNTVFWSRMHDIDYNITVTSLPSGKIVPTPNGLFEGHPYGGTDCGRDSRILTIYYPDGKSMIEIQGTVMVPEFGSSSFVSYTTAIAIVGVISFGILAKKKLV
jgi:hypothetical protein